MPTKAVGFSHGRFVGVSLKSSQQQKWVMILTAQVILRISTMDGQLHSFENSGFSNTNLAPTE